MRKLFLIPIVSLLIVAGCGGGQKEPQAAPLPSGEWSAQATSEAGAPAAASPSSPAGVQNDGSSASGETASADGIVPAEIAIPDIGVDANVIQLGLTKTGAMAVPSDVDEVGWFKPGYRPGVSGHAVIAGHVDSNQGPAVFYKLKNLKKGDKIIVRSKEGQEKVFRVVGKMTYPYKDAPLKEIFGPSDKPVLNLITCTGTFIRSKGTYQERLVVSAELDSAKAS